MIIHSFYSSEERFGSEGEEKRAKAILKTFSSQQRYRIYTYRAFYALKNMILALALTFYAYKTIYTPENSQTSKDELSTSLSVGLILQFVTFDRLHFVQNHGVEEKFRNDIKDLILQSVIFLRH